MALQSSGQIKYSDITAEFGAPNTGGLGQYRLDGGEDVGSLTNLPLDAGVPTSGQIKFSDFYSKKLNHIVDLHSIGNNTSRQIAKDRWNNGNVHIVGSSKTGKGQPPNTEDDRVIINVNNTIRSVKGTQTHCALRTGNWDTNTTLEIEIGTSGKLFGSGGDGGTGGNANETAGTDGQTGSSALGIEYPCTINNLGVIQSGYGGGGGGGGNTRTTGGGKKSGATTNGSSGGGGGGGAGLPAGNAGGVQTVNDDALSVGGGSAGSAGEAGKESNVASGGSGGSEAGDGGDSGGVDQPNGATFHKAEDGGVHLDDNDNQVSANGGLGGANGFALITNQSSLPSFTGNAIIGISTSSLSPT